jgi:hypothetical protein
MLFYLRKKNDLNNDVEELVADEALLILQVLHWMVIINQDHYIFTEGYLKL